LQEEIVKYLRRKKKKRKREEKISGTEQRRLQKGTRDRISRRKGKGQGLKQHIPTVLLPGGRVGGKRRRNKEKKRGEVELPDVG